MIKHEVKLLKLDSAEDSEDFEDTEEDEEDEHKESMRSKGVVPRALDFDDSNLEDRVWPHGVVPPFSDAAHGNPRLWNKVAKRLYWSNRTRCCFPCNATVPDVRQVIEFLELRPGQDGRPVSDK